ncbi:MAG: aldo/keto reductase [Opitutaceae bacterium]|nr:aldo/keto reductase [Opitutaceae bacterium]
MKRLTLGRTGLHVSDLCFGTLNFGWTVSETQAFALLDHYHAAGGNFLHASAFSTRGSPSPAMVESSESFVGRWWRDRLVPRDALTLSTRMVLHPWQLQGASPLEATLRMRCETALRRMRTSHLDLVLLEWNDALDPIDDALESLTRLRRAGLVRYFGAANFSAWRLVQALHRALQRGTDRFDAHQIDLSLLSERSALDQVEAGQAYNLGLLARGPLAGGRLAGPPGTARGLSDRPGGDSAPHTGPQRALRAAAEREGFTPAQIALAWVMARGAVPILGVRTSEHLEELLQASRLTADGLLAPSSLPTHTHAHV